jgi:hypothetical protein
LPKWFPSWATLRDPLIVLTGLALSIYEAVFAPTFHPEVLIAATSIIGAPLFIRKDEQRNARREADGDEK